METSWRRTDLWPACRAGRLLRQSTKPKWQNLVLAVKQSGRGFPRPFGYSCTVTLVITSGVAGGSPRWMASTTSMPEITLPTTVYCPFRKSP